MRPEHTTTVEWIAETSIQIGDPQGPPWPHLGAFLDGFATGVRAGGALSATVLSPDHTFCRNPHGTVSFRFEAPDEAQAQRLAEGAFFRAGLDSGVGAVPAEGQPFGWGASTDVRAAPTGIPRAGVAARATAWLRRVLLGQLGALAGLIVSVGLVAALGAYRKHHTSWPWQGEPFRLHCCDRTYDRFPGGPRGTPIVARPGGYRAGFRSPRSSGERS